MRNDEKSFPALSILVHIFAIPYNFLIGFVVGVAAPVGAIAAMVMGVRFLTGRMPFLHLGRDEEERRLSIELVSPTEVGERFETEKKKVTDDLAALQAEIKAIIEEAKTEAQSGAAKENEE